MLFRLGQILQVFHHPTLQCLIKSIFGKGQLYVSFYRCFANVVFSGYDVGFVHIEMMRLVSLGNISTLCVCEKYILAIFTQ